MELHLKKRIVGAVVTVTALLVVMPIILDGSRTYELLETAAPVKPEAPQWSTPEYEQQVRQEIEDLASGKATSELALSEPEVVEEDTPQPEAVPGNQSAVDAQGLPYAWTLQLGAFSQRANAHRLRDQLRDKGYKAYVQEFPSQGMVRVYVGPELLRDDAESLRERLKKELQQKDIYIRRYEAES